MTVPIEDVARALGMTDPIDWAEVLTRASTDARWSFRTIVLEPRRYTCPRPGVLGVAGGRPIAVVGTGPADWSSDPDRGACLFFPAASDRPALTLLAPGTRLEGVKLQSQGPKLSEPGFPAAIRIHGRATLRDVALMNWRCSVAAIEVHGNGAAMGTDASLTCFDQVRINGVWGAGVGVWVHGSDANAGLYSQVSVANVQNATSVRDSSQLGNTWIGGHVHPSEAAELAGGVNRSPPYVADGAGARSIFVGNYAESGTQPSAIKPPNMWLGGFAPGVAGGGLVLATGELRGARIRAPTIVSERYSTSGLQKVLSLEVNDGPAIGDIDTVEVSYDARLNRLTEPPTPLRATYGAIVALWQNRREIWRASMRVARKEWSPP